MNTDEVGGSIPSEGRKSCTCICTSIIRSLASERGLILCSSFGQYFENIPRNQVHRLLEIGLGCTMSYGPGMGGAGLSRSDLVACKGVRSIHHISSNYNIYKLCCRSQ